MMHSSLTRFLAEKHFPTITSLAMGLKTQLAKLSLLVVAMLGLQGCVFSIVDWVTPKEGYRLDADIAYGELPRQRLDRYTPDVPNNTSLTLVFFYGGAWEAGEKEDYRFVAQAFTELGYSVVIPNYRVYPDGLFPEFMSDAARATQWVADNTSGNMVLIGHSAGAHIAALLALDHQRLVSLGVNHRRIAGLVGLSGPYDFLPLKSKRLKTIFNAADDINNTQPINFVSSAAPPALLLHGQDDTTVKPFNSERLAKRLRAAGVEADLRLYPESAHAITVGALSIPLRNQLPVLTDIEAFLRVLAEQ